MSAKTEIASTLRKKLEGATLQVFKTTWCPDCARLDYFLKSLSLDWPAVNIDLVDGAAQRLEAETGKRGVPYVLVNDQTWVRGYHREHPGRFDSELFLREVEAALG